jgi:hypothetical protein
MRESIQFFIRFSIHPPNYTQKPPSAANCTEEFKPPRRRDRQEFNSRKCQVLYPNLIHSFGQNAFLLIAIYLGALAVQSFLL